MRVPITANVATGASPPRPGSARGLVFANATIVASASLLVAIWLFVPKDTFSGVAAYLPYHLFVETFSIIVSVTIFGVLWNAYRPEQTCGFIILSCAMLAAGLVDFGHMLSVSRMPDFVTPSSPQKGIAFWLAARLFVAIGFLAAALRPESRLRVPAYRYAALGVFAGAVGFVYWIVLFELDVLPRFFIAGQGLTPVKVATEYAIIGIQLVPAFVFWQRARRSRFRPDIDLYTAVSLSILSEAFFTFYVGVHDLFQLLGHGYKVIAYGFLYRAVFVACVHEPFDKLREEIAARQGAQDALHLSGDRFRTLVVATTQMVWTTDAAGRVTEDIPTWRAYTGQTYDEVLGEGWANALHPEDRQRTYEMWMQAVQRRSPYDIEYRMRRRDGEYGWFSVHGAPVIDPGGGIREWIGTCTDITRRKRAEAAARQLAAIVESSEDAIISATSEGLISTWNAGAERLYGYHADEVIGRPILTLVPPEMASEENSILDRVRAGEHVNHYATVRLRKDGSLVEVSLTVSPVKNEAGTIVGISKTARDITAARRVEEKLRAAGLYARSLIEASLDPLVTISAEGKITDVNEATVNVTGVPRERLIGTDFSDYFTEPERARSGYREVFEKGFVTDYPLTIRHADGRLTDVLYNASVYRDEAGAVIGVFAAARDVTERRHAEAEIRELNATLERRVIERTAELDAANKELEAFSYSASHDLRAPLNTIDGFSRALQEDYGDKLDADGRDYLQRLRTASQRMAQLVDDLLRLSRLTRADMVREAVDLSKLARTVADELRESDPAREVAIDIAPDVRVHGDRRLLRVVLENLLNNAWKFTSKHARARIEFGVAEREGERVYYVRDDGAGFDMAHIDKLFVPFQRLHAAADFPGNGIGLATVRRIVLRHGGRVWAEGKPGQGATVYFTLAGVQK